MGGAIANQMASLSNRTPAFTLSLEAPQYPLPLKMTVGVIGMVE